MKDTKKLCKTAIAFTVMMSITLMAPLRVFATGSDLSVVNSGDDADISTSTTSNSTVTVSNSNTATINQSATSTSNTGGNTEEGNIGGGSNIHTGNAVTAFSFEASANENMTAISGTPQTNSMIHMLDIVNTGDDAEVESEMTNTNTVDVTNNNSAYITQNFTAYTNTGDNTSEGNIGPGNGIVTDNSLVSGNFDVTVNKNATFLNLGSQAPIQGMEGSLTNTGDEADIDANSTSETTIQVANYNSALVNQMMNVTQNSGGNSSEGNVGSAGIATGGTHVIGYMNVWANKNTTGIGGMYSAPLGLNIFDIVNTGDELESENTMHHTSTTTVANANTLSQYQTLTQYSNTGDSTSDGNVGSGMIYSGNHMFRNSLAMGGNHNDTVLGNTTGLLALIMGLI